MELENLQDKCGLFGCVAASPWPSDLEISNIISLGLVGLQHRGQESAGIVTCEGLLPLHHHRGMGLVNQIFNIENLSGLRGNLGIGHTRYSTVGASERTNCQPFIVESTYGQFAVAHNGELVNGGVLKRKILQRGIGLSSGTDSEVITQVLCQTPECGEPTGINWPSRIKQLMLLTQLSYSLVILSSEKIYAVRDPYGNRPICLGYLLDQNSRSTSSLKDEAELPRYVGYVVSSETCVFGSIGASFFREILPGEIVEIGRDGFKSCGMVPRISGSPALCIFEYIYFSRPDSFLEGQQVNAVRFRCGEQLARESFIEADVVSGVPESATAAALGYAKQSGIAFVEVLTRNRYVGRTFIQPSKHLRKIGVIKKFGFLQDNFSGKRVILIDDSIVRGNTIAPLVSELKRFGAKEVHLRIASPPIKHPCYMGINIPTEAELIFNSVGTAEKLAREVGADSLEYLSVEGLHKAVNEGIRNKEPEDIGHCNACLTGNYPIHPQF